MVGVPGRSKGCHTCRRRKKGCDKNVPSCHQCIRHGLVCEGYGRELIWINASNEEKENEQALTSRPVEKSKQPRVPWLSAYTKAASTANSSVTISDSLALTAREQKYLGIFWNDYFPNGRAFSDQACMLSTGSWTRAVNNLRGSEPLLHKAMMALSASVLGAQNNDSQLKLKGLQTYCSATVDMLNAVQHQKHSRSDGVLAAVRLLEFYEVLFGFGAKLNNANSNLASWWRHNDGQLALILHRGPYSFQHGPAHTLFVDARYNTALSHLTRRKRCPLDDSDWKAIPWIYCKKSIKDRLVDILVHLPGLMQDMDILQELTLIVAAGEWKKKVLKSCLGLKEALRRWETEIGPELERFDYTVSTTPLKPPSTDREVSLLHLSTLYWAISLAVDSSLGTLLAQNARSGGVEGDCEDDSETESTSSMATSGKIDPSTRRQLRYEEDRSKFLRTYAYKIAHAIPLLFEPESGAFGCNVALFPLLSAWRFLSMTEPVDKPSPEHQIILKLSEKQFQGTSVGRFSASLKRDVWNHKHSGHAAKKD